MNTAATTVKLSELSIDAANVRKTGRGEEPKFAASIRARGVIEPLIVRASLDKGYLIVNGGERFTALEYLMKKGLTADGELVTKDYPVAVVVVDADDVGARATSLATNLIRSDMHPVDEFEAFAQMIKDGATLETISAEYARPVPEIRQALSLAAIAPEIRKAWRAGEIGGDAAEAYAQTKDLAHQVRVFHKLKKRAGDAYDVTEEIAGDQHHEVAKLLKFVTQKTYEAAGHHINPSLFGDDDDDRDATIIDNVPALKAMASRKIEDKILELKKDGWGWAMLKEDAPNDIYAWRRLPGANPKKEQKALAGCTIDINYNGQLEIVRGYVKPGVSVKIEKTPAEKAAARKAGPAKPATISAALAGRLSDGLTKAAAEVVVGIDHESIVRLALAGMICSATYSSSPVCLENKGPGARDDDDADKYQFAAELARLAKLKGRPLAELFAKAIAASVDLGHQSPDRVLIDAEGEVDDEAAAAFVHFLPQDRLQPALRKVFDAGDYFENAPGAMALGALDDMAIDAPKNAKKAVLAKMATDHAKKTGWLPPQLRTAFYSGPLEKKSKTTNRKKRL